MHCFSKFFKAIAVIIIYFLSISNSISTAQKYIEMMDDFSHNFYDVVDEAEKYFENKSIGKGSGWKNYQRWLYENEHKFYPEGDRSNVDPYFVSKSYKEFVRKNPVDRSLFSGDWVELGPLFIGQVTGHYSAGLGRVEAFYSDPNNSQLIYMGSRSGGFWKTSDGGNTWSGGSTDFLIASGVNTMTVSPTNPDSILINIRNAKNGTSHGIYRSVDGGENWVVTNFNPANLGWGGLGSNRAAYVIAYHPSVPNLVYIGTNNGLFRSDDNLATWTQLLSTYDINEIAFHPTNSDIMYAGASNNKTIVLVSVDNGLTFSTSPIPGNSSNVRLSTSANCPSCLFIGTSDGIWKSIDEGGIISLSSTPGISNYGAFAVSDVDTSIMLFGDIDTHMSTDGGQTFTKTTFWSQGNSGYNTNPAYVHADIRGAICQDGVFWTGTDGFLCKSLDNGINWERFEGQGIRENYNLGVSQSNHYRTICGSQDNGTSINTENGWIEFYGADGMEGIIHPLNDDWMIGSLQNGGRRRTRNGGITQDGVTPSSQTGSWIAPLFYNPNDQMTVYSLGENVHKSEDYGSTWTNVGSPSFTGTISFATIAENNTDIIVVTRSEKIEKSTDGGMTFNSIKNNLPSYSITDVVFDPNDDNVIVVTYGRYNDDNSKVFITTDQGLTWQNITYNLNNMPVRAAVIDHTAVSTIYLGTEIGVYKKAMADNTWSLYNPALPNMTILELEVMRGSNTLRAATWGRGLWEYTLDGRVDYPTILSTSITDLPTDNTPKEGVNQFVTSEITSDNALTNVYVDWSINSPVFGNILPMSNTGGDTWETDDPFPFFPVGTKIYFKVIAESSTGDITETYKYMYTVRPFEYCEAIGTSSAGNLFIQQATVANISHASGNDSYTFYQDSIVELDLDSTYTITVNANTSWSENDFGAWIDYNYDAIFDTSEEVLFSIGPGNTATANFTVPSSAIIEQMLRLRIRLSYWGANPDACGSTLGEVEDYAVWITGPCELLVSTTATSGSGSLPYAISCALPGDTIRLSNTLDGLTISLGLKTLVIDKNITILADTGTTIQVTATGNKPALTLTPGHSLTLKNFILKSTSTTRETIFNLGTMTMENMTIKHATGIECVRNTANATLNVLGNCQLENY